MDSPDADRNWLYALEWQGYDGPWSDIEEDVDKTNAVLKRHYHVMEPRTLRLYVSYRF